MARAGRIPDLITAAFDVRPGDPPVRSMTEATDEHRARFDRYVRELRKVKKIAEQWWNGLLEAETERIGDENHAEINVRIRRPAGPIVNPMAIHAVRSGWLDCQDINDRSPERARVAPAAFVLAWLDEAGRHDLAAFVSALPYWPLGLDDSGRWV